MEKEKLLFVRKGATQSKESPRMRPTSSEKQEGQTPGVCPSLFFQSKKLYQP